MTARLLGGLALGLLALLPRASEAQTTPPLVDSLPSITVTGEARREVAPDLAIVSLGVVTDRAAARDASRDNAQAAAAVVAAARASGVTDAEIQTSEIGLSAVTDPRDASKVRTFRASNRITLRLHDLRRVGELVGTLAAQGANDIDGITFSLADPEPLRDDLRAAATRDAARKAEIHAKAAGVRLGRILRIAPDASVAPAMMSRAFKVLAMPAPAPPPVEAGATALEEHVQVTWELVP